MLELPAITLYMHNLFAEGMHDISLFPGAADMLAALVLLVALAGLLVGVQRDDRVVEVVVVRVVDGSVEAGELGGGVRVGHRASVSGRALTPFYPGGVSATHRFGQRDRSASRNGPATRRSSNV